MDKNKAELDGVVIQGCFRTCTKCGERKPLEDFGLRRMKGPGSEVRNQSQCKECR